jgi:hypothetical protein
MNQEISVDISFWAQRVTQEVLNTQWELQRPSMILKPRLFRDGNKFCALYGDNLVDGCAGFGDSPDDAMRDFDREWTTKWPAAPPETKEK